jgi:peptide/nickel transport system substrate-binding protein
MYNQIMTDPDPVIFMRNFLSSEVANKSNKWQGRNSSRWRSAEYDATYAAAEAELDPIKRAALYIKLNELVVDDGGVIPIVYRPSVAGLGSNMRAVLSGWDNYIWMLSAWYRVA